METHFALHWNDYGNQITDAFGSLLHEEDLVDVTLSCGGSKIKAHKMLLSACSPYFHSIFKENPCQHPVIVFRNVMFEDLKAIVEFIYCGEVNVLQEQMERFLETAEMLEVKGLTGKGVEVVETDDINRTDQEIIQTSRAKESQTKTRLGKKVSTSERTRCISPPGKRKKLDLEKPLDEGSCPKEVALVIKEEVRDIEIVDVQGINVSTPEVPESLSVQIARLGRTASQEERESPETSHENANVVQNLAMEFEEEQNQTLTNNQTGDGSITGKETSVLDEKRLPKTTSVPIKKRKNIAEDEAYLESGFSPESECSALLKAKQSTSDVKTAVKDVVKIPRGLTVTSIQTKSQVRDLFDFPNQDTQDEALRSEDATTPVHGEQTSDSQDTTVCEDVPPEEPDIAEEAPNLQEEQTQADVPGEEEPKEPEFDYFGCEVCMSEAKPVDLERISFNQKCPICPFVCFCAHLLKDHMKVIHGWFNVQRRFTHY